MTDWRGWKWRLVAAKACLRNHAVVFNVSIGSSGVAPLMWVDKFSPVSCTFDASDDDLSAERRAECFERCTDIIRFEDIVSGYHDAGEDDE